VTLSGQFTIDSFNSDDGPYDPSTAQENATVAALIEKDGAVDGSGQGKVLGNVSVVDGATVSTSGQFVVSGEISYDADQTIPDVTVPFTPSSDTAITKTKTIAVSDGGTVDVSASKISLSSKSVLTFSGSGTIRVYVEGDISLSGQSYIKVAPSPDADLKVEIYVDGSVSLSGQGVVNDADLASSFSIWGTENCTSVSVSGQGEFVGTIYAPYADVTLSGQGDITGAVLGDTITCSGQGDIHIDEALMGDSDVASGEKYTRIEWVEL
jgi:choice-of-anchor A domain-containing protein